jgi:hypothetical protein
MEIRSLDFFRMFFFPIRIKNKSADSQGDNNTHQKDECKFIHLYSPLFKKVPMIRNAMNNIVPTIIGNQENFSGAAMLAMINATKTACAKFKQILANPSFCRRLNFIDLILSQIRNFVKKFSPILLLFTLHLTLYTDVYAQEIDVKTKIKELKDKDPVVRMLAVKELGKARKKEAVPKLMESLKTDKNSDVRASAAEALAYVGDHSVISDIITQVSKETEAKVKFSAITSLGYLGDESVVPTLKQFFLNKDENLGVRLRAGDALGNFPSEAALESLKEMLTNEDSKIRCQSIVSLGNIPDYRTEEKIKLLRNSAENDPDENVRKTARFVLRKFGVEK